eukprot:jgi/Bigna1/130662/aug1.12_g5370
MKLYVQQHQPADEENDDTYVKFEAAYTELGNRGEEGGGEAEEAEKKDEEEEDVSAADLMAMAEQENHTMAHQTFPSKMDPKMMPKKNRIIN